MFLLSRVCTVQGYLLEVVLSCSVEGISFEARSEFVSLSIVLPPTLNSQMYVHVSDKRMLFSLPFFISLNFVLIHDNVQPHSDAVVIYFQREVFITTVEWSAKSPCFKPTHLWGLIKKRRTCLSQRYLSYKPCQAVVSCSARMADMERPKNLIRSMSMRISSAIKATKL